MKKESVLLIAGSDSSAGAGIQADIKTFSFFKVYAATIFTALTAQNTKGVNKILNVPCNFIEEQIKCIAEDLNIAFIKIGMLSNIKIIKTVNNCLEKYFSKVPIILDPVMVAKGGHPLLEKNSINFLKKNVLSKSFLITPNRLEAEEILKFKINNVDNLTKIKKAFNNLGVQRILLKGGHISENQNNITDINSNIKELILITLTELVVV